MTKPEKILADILAKRGITAVDALSEYLSDKPKLTYDPFLLPDMEDGADRILLALELGENICIYGDYDVDGVTSTVLLSEFIEALAEKCGMPIRPAQLDTYIPSRMDEGYGLNFNALKTIRDRGTNLVITVDCGSISGKEIEYAESIGLDVIVTDHHSTDDVLAPNVPLINPRRKDSIYPYEMLSGCGVAFKLAQALKTKYDDEYAGTEGAGKKDDLTPNLNALLDLVAIATIADVMPLTGENRTLVKYGLKRINKGARPQLLKLMTAIGLTPGKVTSYNIAFGIAPHLNAAGRIDDAALAESLFTEKVDTKTDEIVSKLIERNKERRRLQESCLEDCVRLTEEKYKDQPFLLLSPDIVHEGIAGIVAGKIRGIYGLPSAVLSPAETETGEPALKGSARSIEGVDIIGLLRSHEELFLKLGGHAMAAGFLIPAENEIPLRESLVNDIEGLLAENPDLLAEHEKIDCALSAGDVTLELARVLLCMQPTGVGNPAPVLQLLDVKAGNIKKMGGDNQHVKFTASASGASGDLPNESAGTADIECIRFHYSEEDFKNLSSGARLNLIGNVDINLWNGQERLQFIVSKMSLYK